VCNGGSPDNFQIQAGRSFRDTFDSLNHSLRNAYDNARNGIPDICPDRNPIPNGNGTISNLFPPGFFAHSPSDANSRIASYRNRSACRNLPGTDP